MPTLCRYPFIVVAHRGASSRLGAVSAEIYPRCCILELAQFVGSGEASTREVGFIAIHAIEFGGMSDGFVDGEPQVGGFEDECSTDARGAFGSVHFFNRLFGNSFDLTQKVCCIDMLVTNVEGWTFVVALLSIPVCDRSTPKSWIAAVEGLLNQGTFCRGKGFVLAGEP